MNKILKYSLIGILVLGALWAAAFFIKSNSKSAITYETMKPFISNIEKKTVATGKVVPEDEIEIKPQISGIIEKIYLEEGVEVKAGDLIALIKVVPNEQSLNQSRGRVRNAELALNNVKIEYNRNKALFDKGVISSQDFNSLQLQYDQAEQELSNSQSDYQIIRRGSAGGSSSANTNIRATVNGTILEIPVEEGDQVIQSNNFNDGTTIATIADLGKMIFEGVKLMFIGMTTVMLFLVLMILLIQLASYLTRGATAREVESIRLEREMQALRKKKATKSSDADEDIAVIAAAVAAYETERFARA